MSIREKVINWANAESKIQYTPAEGVLAEGRDRIEAILHRNSNVYVHPQEFGGWAWTTREGKIAKRIRSAYAKAGVKLPAEVVEKIGNVAALYRARAVVLRFTRDFDWEPGAFGDGNSCFFGGMYSHARSTIYASGGFAIQVFMDGNPVGRCFGMPSFDGIVLFNAYGMFSSYQIADYVANVVGGKPTSVMMETPSLFVYVNKAARYEEGAGGGRCGRGVYVGRSYRKEDFLAVDFVDTFEHGEYSPIGRCRRCERRMFERNLVMLHTLCPTCASDYPVCRICGDHFDSFASRDNHLCRACVRMHEVHTCDECGEQVGFENNTPIAARQNSPYLWNVCHKCYDINTHSLHIVCGRMRRDCRCNDPEPEDRTKIILAKLDELLSIPEE